MMHFAKHKEDELNKCLSENVNVSGSFGTWEFEFSYGYLLLNGRFLCNITDIKNFKDKLETILEIVKKETAVEL